MILDTSAIISAVNQDPCTHQIMAAMGAADQLLMSAGTWLELFIVIDARDPRLSGKVEYLLTQLGVQVVEVTPAQAALARQAYRNFGRRNHPARLNFGDCFAYALAKACNDSLLFVGNDFNQTDVRSALK